MSLMKMLNKRGTRTNPCDTHRSILPFSQKILNPHSDILKELLNYNRVSAAKIGEKKANISICYFSK